MYDLMPVQSVTVISLIWMVIGGVNYQLFTVMKRLGLFKAVVKM